MEANNNKYNNEIYKRNTLKKYMNNNNKNE